MRPFDFLILVLLGVTTPGLARAQVPSSPATRPSESDRRRVSELSRRAVDLIDRHQFSEARHALQDALTLIPDNSTCLYNLASVDAATGRRDEAMSDLQSATEAGFTDFTQLERNLAFRVLQNDPRYQRLLARKDEIRHRAAGRILSELKSEFGERYLYAVDEPRKLVFATGLGQASLDELESAVRRELESQNEQVFSHPPDEFIRVIIALPVDFVKLQRLSGLGGYYDDSTRTVMVKRLGPELRHEFTHAVHAADQHALDQEHPVWLSEGLATLYEYPVFELSGGDDHGRLIPADNWRLARVQAAAKRNALIPLDKLVHMDRTSFTARADLAYGESGSLLLYLYEHQLLRKFYDAYTAGYAKDAAGLTALETATAMKWTELQTAWIDWLLPRPVPPKTANGG